MIIKKPIAKPLAKLPVKSAHTLGSNKPAVFAKPKPAAGAFQKPSLAQPSVNKGKISSTGAFALASAEKKKQDLKRSRPFGVVCPVGGTLEVYLLDATEPWTRYEHNIGGGPKSKGEVYPCIKDGDEACPACQKEGKEGAFVMYLTAVVPVETYENKDKEEITRRFQKKTFAIKTKMSGKYARLYEKYGTFRGLVLKLSRDDKMDAQTGNDFDVIRILTEAEIQKFAKGDAFKGDTKEQIIKAKLAEPFDYDKVMPRPIAAELAAMLGVRTNGSGAPIGSSFDDDEEAVSGAADGWGV